MPIDISNFKIDPWCWGVTIAERRMVCRHCGDVPKGTHMLTGWANRHSANICRSCVEKAMSTFLELDRRIAAGLPTG